MTRNVPIAEEGLNFERVRSGSSLSTLDDTSIVELVHEGDELFIIERHWFPCRTHGFSKLMDMKS